MSISIRVSHETPGADKAVRVKAIPPQGAAVISVIEPGNSAVFEVSDCNELHIYEWDASPKDDAEKGE